MGFAWNLDDNLLFAAYLFYSIIVIIKMILVPILFVVPARIKNNVYLNPEDAKKFDRRPVHDDPDVERSRRVHQNDLENIPAFVLVGLFYIICKPSLWIAVWHFRIFTVSRFLHTACYIMGLSPWRGIAFAIGYTVLLSMSVQVLLTVCW